MRIEQPEYRCDNCEKARTRDVNHWFVLYTSPIVLTSESVHALVIVKWNSEIAETVGSSAHSCGEACMIKLAQRFFATGSFEKPKPADIPPPQPAPADDVIVKGVL